MTVALVILAVLTVLASSRSSNAARTSRDRIWRQERERLEAYGERMAAHNGHPDGDIVAISPATRPETPADR